MLEIILTAKKKQRTYYKTGVSLVQIKNDFRHNM